MALVSRHQHRQFLHWRLGQNACRHHLLARLLSARGFHVDVLSRGYGRTSREPALVDPDGTADEYGDEPLLIASKSGVPVYVATERYDAGRLAEQQFIQQGGELSADPVPSLFILDDGFQHRYSSIAKLTSCS